jgi:hypothetical protein
VRPLPGVRNLLFRKTGEVRFHSVISCISLTFSQFLVVLCSVSISVHMAPLQVGSTTLHSSNLLLAVKLVCWATVSWVTGGPLFNSGQRHVPHIMPQLSLSASASFQIPDPSVALSCHAGCDADNATKYITCK